MQNLTLLFLGATMLGTPEQARVTVAEDGLGTFIERRDDPVVAFAPQPLVASSTFRDFVRLPAETSCSWLFCFVPMKNNTGYYRDRFIGARIDVEATHDGQTWHAKAIQSDGTRLTWGPVTYYSYWNGYTNCFVGSWALCGTLKATIWFYTASQCVMPTGNWAWEFFEDGQLFTAAQHDFRPSLPPGTVTLFNQGASPWGTDPYDSTCATYDAQGNVITSYCGPPPLPPPPSSRRWQIREKGCYLTAAAEMLSYHRVNTNPRELNEWLTNNDGYDSLGKVKHRAIARFAKTKNVTIDYRGRSTGTTLAEDTCRLGPPIIKPRRGHWATVTGYTSDTLAELNLADPDGGRVRTFTEAASKGLPPGETAIALQDAQTRVFTAPAKGYYLDNSGILITIHSPVHAVVTDPQRRRVGFNVASGRRFNEIPGAEYDDEGMENLLTGELDLHPGKSIDIVKPIEGNYQLDLTGTGNGSYSVSIEAYARDFTVLKAFVDKTFIRKGESHAYRIAYSPEPGVQPKVSGGFPGGGQRPRDVDLFLSYSRPVTSRTTLPAGETSYPLAIHYGPTIDPDTLTVLLNGHDITREFQPARDGAETVAIELSPGRHVLKLTVDGLAGNRVATDTDRLVFLVQ